MHLLNFLKKKRSGEKLTQCDTNLLPAIYVVFLNKVFQFHQFGSVKANTSGTAIFAFFEWPQLAICALDPHFSTMVCW